MQRQFIFEHFDKIAHAEKTFSGILRTLATKLSPLAPTVSINKKRQSVSFRKDFVSQYGQDVSIRGTFYLTTVSGRPTVKSFRDGSIAVIAGWKASATDIVETINSILQRHHAGAESERLFFETVLSPLTSDAANLLVSYKTGKFDDWNNGVDFAIVGFSFYGREKMKFQLKSNERDALLFERKRNIPSFFFNKKMLDQRGVHAQRFKSFILKHFGFEILHDTIPS